MTRIQRLFIANRGEIAVRIIRAARSLGIETVLGVSSADRDAEYACLADRVICLGPSAAESSYLNQEAIVTSALGSGCDALHPGYGFLAENPHFAALCREHGLDFVGPASDVIALMGQKLAARKVAVGAGIPVLPGSMELESLDHALACLSEIGAPALVKAAAGGGGKGMKVVTSPDELRTAWPNARAESKAAFGDDTLYLERYVERARHVEVQVLADQIGSVITIGDRDCSAQRRYQKVVEEAPAPFLPDFVRESMHDSAIALCAAVNYTNAGTVEFVYDPSAEQYWFLEMNTRIQVEHTVTEQISGLDLVAMQILVAGGEPLGMSQADVTLSGHAVECRINAEDPSKGFWPSPGTIESFVLPDLDYCRVDTYCSSGAKVPPFYDSLIAKIVVSADNRVEALKRMDSALGRLSIIGIETNASFLRRVIADPEFVERGVTTEWLEESFLPSLV